MKYLSTLRRLRPHFEKDRDYFVRLWRVGKEDWRQSLIMLIGLTCLFAVTLLYLEAKVIDVNTWKVSFVAVSAVMVILSWRRIRRKIENGKSVQHDFDPVSLGTLYFGFALTLWTSKQIGDLDLSTKIIATFASLISFAFIVAIFSRPIRTRLNARVTPYLLGLTLFAFIFSFTFGWLSAISPKMHPVLLAVVYFGFVWILTILLVLFRDVKNELIRFSFAVFFAFVGIVRGLRFDPVDMIGAVVLIITAILIYLVATGRLHPCGKVV